MVPQVGGHRFPCIEQLGDPGVGDVAGHHEGPGQGEPGLHRMLRQLAADGVHGLVQVDGDHHGREVVVDHVGKEPGRVLLQLLQEDPLGADLPQGLPVGGARDGDPHGVGGAVPGESDHPDVVAEVLATELGPDPEATCHLQDLRLPFEVTEAVAGRATAGGEVVEVVGRGVLGGPQGVLGRGAADDDGQVVRRAGRRTEGPELLVQEAGQALGVQEGLGLVEEEALVCRAAALGHEQELVGIAGHRLDLDLGGEVRPGVAFGEHVQRGQLRVAQVGRQEGVVYAAGDRFPVVAVGEHQVALPGRHDGRARVLA